jgi:hypothetical protein
VGKIDSARVTRRGAFDTNSELTANTYWLREALPRAYVASDVRLVSSEKAALEALSVPGLVARECILEGPASFLSDGAKGVDGKARIVEYRNSYVLCEAEASSPTYLVLLDSFYPGWVARVDGKPVSIQRANYAFRAVQIPAGRHKIEFIFRSGAVYLGLTISVATVLLGVAIMIWRGGRKAKRINDEVTSDG